MPAINFYLKQKKSSQPTLIFLQFYSSGRRLVFSFGQSIHPKDWDLKKQRVKGNKATTADGKFLLNDLLDNLENECKSAYNSLLKNGVPSIEDIKRRLSDFMYNNSGDNSKDDLFSLAERFCKNEIPYKGKSRKYNTVRSYRTTYNHLKEFARHTKSKVDFDTISLDFYYKFISYLKKEGLNTNSVGKEIKILKVFLAEALDLGLSDNLQFRHKKFAVPREDTEAVYLTWDEILKLYRFDLSNRPALERTRDLFVFACCVGLRYSDFSRITPENIVKDGPDFFIKIKTQKTGETVIIPASPLVLELFKKYEDRKNRLPAAVSNQKFNLNLKTIAREAGLKETGRITTDPDLELWQCIASHTGRRSFATNYFLENFPVIDLMRITGHKTEKSFMRYIKTSKLDSAKRMHAHIKKNWSKQLLKVAG